MWRYGWHTSRIGGMLKSPACLWACALVASVAGMAQPARNQSLGEPCSSDLRKRATARNRRRTEKRKGIRPEERKTQPTQRHQNQPKDGLTYVWIPPGSFTMGCSPGDNGCFDYEKPAHWVT